MKKFLLVGIALALLGGAAQAAERAVRAPYAAPYAAPAAPVASWTGFYIGINGGYSAGSDDVTQTARLAGITAFSPFPSSLNPKGGFFGGQVGYNWQTGPIVWGVEGDWQGASQTSTTVCGGLCVGAIAGGVTAVAASSVYQKVNSFATARARVGWDTNGTLMYVTGGGAWMSIDETDAVTARLAGLAIAQAASFSSTKSGYSIGVGMETRLWSGWSAKLEYLHLDVSGTTNTFAVVVPGVPATPFTTTSGRIHDEIIRAGLNWKFGGFGGVY